MPSDVIRRWRTRFALGNRVKNGVLALRASVFLAKTGGARYQVRAFSALLPNALHGPPQ
jgi:hypothetical protein